MESLEEYADKAARLTRTEFANRYPMAFLLKRPAKGAGAEVPITFRTHSIAVTPQGLLAEEGGFSEEWWVWPLTKKPLNPFPERLSLGRATNCDIVFRLGYVSKLHAHLLFEGDKMSIVDQGSANGTEVNGTSLARHVPHALRLGDRLKLGRRLELEVLDSARLYDLLHELIPS